MDACDYVYVMHRSAADVVFNTYNAYRECDGLSWWGSSYEILSTGLSIRSGLNETRLGFPVALMHPSLCSSICPNASSPNCQAISTWTCIANSPLRCCGDSEVCSRILKQQLHSSSKPRPLTQVGINDSYTADYSPLTGYSREHPFVHDYVVRSYWSNHPNYSKAALAFRISRAYERAIQ